MSDLKEKEVAVEAEVETVVEAEVVKEKPYTLRDLTDEDLYTVLEIVAIALPEEAKESFSQAVSSEEGKKKTIDKIGGLVAFDMVRCIMKNMKAVKSEVYAFLSDLSGIPADDIRKMPFGTTPAMLKEVFTNAKNADFFTELFKSLK